MAIVTLFGKPGCHLCDDARAIIGEVLTGFPDVTFDELSILDDPALLDEYAVFRQLTANALDVCRVRLHATEATEVHRRAVGTIAAMATMAGSGKTHAVKDNSVLRITFDKEGRKLGHRFFRGLINVLARIATSALGPPCTPQAWPWQTAWTEIAPISARRP